MGLEPELLNARTTFVAVQARLVFRSKADEEAVLELMRRFSAAYRWTYRRLLALGGVGEVVLGMRDKRTYHPAP